MTREQQYWFERRRHALGRINPINSRPKQKGIRHRETERCSLAPTCSPRRTSPFNPIPSFLNDSLDTPSIIRVSPIASSSLPSRSPPRRGHLSSSANSNLIPAASTSAEAALPMSSCPIPSQHCFLSQNRHLLIPHPSPRPCAATSTTLISRPGGEYRCRRSRRDSHLSRVYNQ